MDQIIKIATVLICLSFVACAPIRPEVSNDYFYQYLNSNDYRQYVTDEVRKVLPEDLRRCKGMDAFALAETQVLLQQQVKFKAIADVAIWTTHHYGNPVEGHWLQKILVSACGEPVGIEIEVQAVPEEFPALNIKFIRNAKKEIFLKVVKSRYEKMTEHFVLDKSPPENMFRRNIPIPPQF